MTEINDLSILWNGTRPVPLDSCEQAAPRAKEMGQGRERSRLRQEAAIKVSDPNGTYLSFLGWPYFRISSLAIARGLMRSG